MPSKAISFDEADRVRRRKTGAFFRHRKNGHFILAIESGRHTNPENGNSYRTFAVWKPEAARASYIHDDELSEDEIFVSILDEGEGVTLVSGLKLRRVFVHLHKPRTSRR